VPAGADLAYAHEATIRGNRATVSEQTLEESRAKAGRRQPELDALRGLMLIWMTLTHLPTHASAFSNQTLGFVSAAEGFIFLSAFLSGRIFGRKLDESGFRDVAHKLFGRAGRLYVYHLFLLAVAFTAVAIVAVHTQRPSLQGLVDFYLAHPIRGMLASILLVYRPPLLDILPMYILFLFGTPFVLLVGKRKGWEWVLIPSVGVWLAAQFGLRYAAYVCTCRLTGVSIPFSALGAFDLFGWQFLWVAGLWIGSGGLWISRSWIRSRITIACVVALTSVFFYARHSYLWNDMNNSPWTPFTDKWHLGVLRLVNFAALGVLFAAFQPFLSQWLAMPPLVTLGRASLEVFCAHLLICFEALALFGDGTNLGTAPQLALIAASMVALYVVGLAFAKRAD
jgi:hypothetical protein